MAKSKAQVIVTISVEPHTPASAVTIEVAHAGKDMDEILAALVVEKWHELKSKRSSRSAQGPSEPSGDTSSESFPRGKRARGTGVDPSL